MLRLDVDSLGNIVLKEVQWPSEAETGRSLYIQTDWDFPGIAADFGWSPCPFCRFTDGTIDCVHRNAGAMIQSARNFLDNHIGEFCENPGYELTNLVEDIPA